MSSLFQSIPPGWQRTTLRRLAQGPKNGAWGSEAGEDEVDAVCVRVADFDWPRLTLNLNDPTIRSFKKPQFRNLQLRPGDIVIEKSGGGEKTPVGRVVSFDEDAEAVTSNFVARIRPHESVCSRFLLYLLAAHYMSGYSHQFIKQNTGIQNLDDTNLFRSDVWVPDLATQRQIADFLDRETARIDLLIEKKQRLVALLGEKLEAHLEEALFGELTKTVPLRRALTAIEQGWSPDCEARNKEGNEWGVLKVGCVNGWKFSSSEHKALPKNLIPRPELEIHEGDLLMSRANTPDLVGSAAIVSDVPRKLMLCDKLYRLKVDTRLLLPSFALLVLRSKAARRHYSSCSNGASASMQNISQETVRTLPIPTPPLDRQAELAAVFESRKAKVGHVVTGINCSIERLKEYRSALFAAAVTGQIDVQTYTRPGSAERKLDTFRQEIQA